MAHDPTFKKRFGIETETRYLSDVVVEKVYTESFERAWKKVLKTLKPNGSFWRRKRFDAFLKRVEKLHDDLPYCNRIEIRYISKKIGFGVFAKKKIPPYSILNHYAGILKPDRLIHPDNDSAFTFSDFPSYTIDGKSAGNWCRFMNHSPEGDPKTNVIAWEHYAKQGPRIIFTAGSKGIKKGEQLLYSYGEDYWEDAKFQSF